MATQLIDNHEASRYELVAEGEVVAIEDYVLDGEQIDLVHTEVFEGHDGKGYARILVAEVLADLRRRGLAVLPSCPYVAKVIREHPEDYLDLVPLEARERFELPR